MSKTEADQRKETPMARGLLDYFPTALAEVSRVSRIANEQHNPGEEMHWSRGKSTDHADCIIRHLVDRGKLDTDGMRHSAKVAWRALALLQEELEAAGAEPGRASTFPEEQQPTCPSCFVDIREALYYCTRPKGHGGQHRCGDSPTAVTWDDNEWTAGRGFSV